MQSAPIKNSPYVTKREKMTVVKKQIMYKVLPTPDSRLPTP
ncbi:MULTISPECIES: hypothetical protein [Moorena]|nr:MULTISPECIES: hypothetical protein [Moorena]